MKICAQRCENLHGVCREQDMENSEKSNPKKASLTSLFRMASVACGMQFGWALQFSLVTPYVQELGISHVWASLIWLCGPVTGMFISPLVGYMSDQCRSSWGRRRPFIVAGACLIVSAVCIVGFSADLGFLLGDTALSRPRAISIFVVAFWIFDVANNTLQGPGRALLADFTGDDHRRARIAYAFYSLHTAVGNILGYAAGSYDKWYQIFPFTRTAACTVSCANLKSAFLVDIILLVCTTSFSVISANETPLASSFPTSDDVSDKTPLIGPNPGLKQTLYSKEGEALRRTRSGDEEQGIERPGESFVWDLMTSFRGLSRPVRLILAVNAVSWIAWYPFYLYDTDWMGREIYRGNPSEVEISNGRLYEKGVSMGALGLVLNAMVLGLTSLTVESMCKRWGTSIVWGVGNIMLSVCFAGMLAISFAAKHMAYSESGFPPTGIVVGALAVFAILGAPMAVASSVPYALISMFTHTAGGGQGLSMGVLNLSIVIPQLIVALGSGPWDQILGGGNWPSFSFAAGAAIVSGLLAIVILPKSEGHLHGPSLRSRQ